MVSPLPNPLPTPASRGEGTGPRGHRVTGSKFTRSNSGSLIAELIVAIAILTIAVIPMAYTFRNEEKLIRSSYQRGVAMELVDGEMEILLAGEWRAFKEGAQTYTFHADAAKNLPPGRAELTLTGKHLRLDWLPAKKTSGGEVVREANVK